MGWLQLYVTADGATAESMQRIDATLTTLGWVYFCTSNGLPIQDADGTWEVRVYDDRIHRFVEWFLAKEGVMVVSEIRHF